MRGIDDALDSCPRRQLPSSRLSAGNLLQGRLKVYLSVFRTLQSQLAHVIVSVLTNEIPRLLID
jgi:hypothetical protein